MWLESLRDLQWRKRRFTIAVAATSLVFGLSLLLAGISASFTNETKRTIEAVGADAWLVADGVIGPFSGTQTMPRTESEAKARAAGAREAVGASMLHFTIQRDTVIDVNVLGVPDGTLGHPPLSAGRDVRASGEAVADDLLGLELGERIAVGGQHLTVVGQTSGVSMYAGQPLVFVRLADVQAVAFGGRDDVTMVLTRGVPTSTPPGMRVLTPREVRADMTRPIEKAVQTISFINVLLWIVAAGIIGSIIYLSALERMRDFAVYKATGATNRSLLSGLALQAVILAGMSAVLATLIAIALRPAFPLPVEIPRSAFIGLPVVAIAVGLLASLGGLRRAVAVDPAAAFAGA